jgi:hypothetical protein
MSYIPKTTRRDSLLTRSRPHSYSKALGLQNRVRDAAETRNGASKTTCEIDEKNQIEEQFIPSRAFHQISGGRVREITKGERFEPRTIESFDPATRELYRLLTATIHPQQHNTSESNHHQKSSSHTEPKLSNSRGRAPGLTTEQ